MVRDSLSSGLKYIKHLKNMKEGICSFFTPSQPGQLYQGDFFLLFFLNQPCS